MKATYLYLLLLFGALTACNKDNDQKDGEQLFTLSKTALSFTNAKGSESVDILGNSDNISVSFVTENDGWCKFEVKKDGENQSIVVSVEENLLITNRNVTIQVIQGERNQQLIIRQAQKYYATIPQVLNLSATEGPRKVTLSWAEPQQANFGHVVLSCTKGDGSKVAEKRMEKGVTSYTFENLLSSDGEYTFAAQSFDYENEAGDRTSVKAKAKKLVIFQFKETFIPTWVPYYLRSSDRITSSNLVGSDEFNEDEEVTISFELDHSLLEEYNATHVEQVSLMPEDAYTLSSEMVYTGTKDYQNLSFEILTTVLNDRGFYAIPLKIKSVSADLIDETKNRVLFIYKVEDLAGWYTVARLEKCGEGAGSYPAGAKRYIKRTGTNTWETGYLFRTYSSSEESGKTSVSADVQYITIDVNTKAIHIQQGSYATSQDLNVYNLVKNELTIEYLYSAWAGWWTHERMYNREFPK